MGRHCFSGVSSEGPLAMYCKREFSPSVMYSVAVHKKKGSKSLDCAMTSVAGTAGLTGARQQSLALQCQKARAQNSPRDNKSRHDSIVLEVCPSWPFNLDLSHLCTPLKKGESF